MTLKEFAEKLNGTEYNGYPIFSKEDIGIAKENGFVIVTGASDDLMEFEGAVEDEAGCFDGGKVYISKNGVEEDKTKNVINAVHEACDGRVLKVIIETCLLTEEEKIKMCEIVTAAGAEYIKTSTGFSTGGATPGDIVLMKKHVGPDVKIKAAGGIKDFSDAELMLSLGADRLGTSRLVKAMKEKEQKMPLSSFVE